MVSQNNVSVTEWPRQARFGRAENGDHRHAEAGFEDTDRPEQRRPQRTADGTTGPAPLATTSGARPAMKANDVI